MRKPRHSWLIPILLCLFVCIGCGRPVPVEGVVTLNGEPLERAMVFFMPLTGGSQGAWLTDEAGHFMVRGNKEFGLPPGEYRVAVSKMVYPPGVRAPDPRNMGDIFAKTKVMVESLPPDYSSPGATKLQADVPAEGIRDVHIDLTLDDAHLAGLALKKD